MSVPSFKIPSNKVIFIVSFLLLTVNLSFLQAQQPVSDPLSGIVGAGVADAIRHDGYADVVIAFAPAYSTRDGAQPSLREMRRAVATQQNSVLADLTWRDYAPRRNFRAVPAMAGRIQSFRALLTIANNPNVVKIDLDLGGTGSLADVVTLVSADEWQDIGITGEGVTVAVLDSGYEATHDDLSDALVGEACFLDFDGSIDGNGRCPNGSDRQFGAGAAADDQGHGTSVSGVITSNGNVSSVGVAPDADIVAVKVIDFNNSFAFLSEVVAGLDYIITNEPDVDIINLSLGTNANYVGDCDNATAGNMAAAAAVNTLRANGVITFASAGNDGSNDMGSPGCLSNVISVGATDKNDNVAGFTQSSNTTDIFAPGVAITTTGLGNGTATVNGTSFSSPTAAGCAALLIESGIATTPDEIETFLESSPTTVTSFGVNFPRIDCFNGVGTTVAMAGPTSVNEGQTATYIYTTQDNYATSYSTTPVCVMGTISNQSFNGATGSGSFNCTFPDGPNNGTATVIVTANPLGTTGTASVNVTVNNVDPTIASVSNSGPIDEGSSATVTVTASDPAGAFDPLTYEFDCDGNGSYEVGPQASNSASCGYDDNGLFTVNVRVNDGDGGSDTSSTQITVDNVAPTADFGFASATPPLIVTETATLSLSNPVDPSPVDTFSYAFDCEGDGTFSALSTDSTYECQFMTAGMITVAARIYDDDGGFTEYTEMVEVLSIEDALRDLIDRVVALQDPGPLNGGQVNALTVKVGQAANSFLRGRSNAATNQLGAFINQVEAFERSGKLTSAQAAELLERATRIQDAIAASS